MKIRFGTFKYCVKGFNDIQQEVVKTGKLFIKKSKKAFTIVKRNKKGEIEGTFSIQIGGG